MLGSIQVGDSRLQSVAFTAVCVAQLWALAPVYAQTAQPAIWPSSASPIPLDPAIEAHVNETLAGMSLEEKVGQIIQADIASITPEEAARFHIGSVLNGGDSGPGGDLRAKPQVWLDLADAFWDASTAGGGVPLLWGTDAVHGHANIVGATIFPHNIGLGAARDPDLIERISAITATEIAVTGLDWNFAPVLAAPRNLRWGRTYEGYSENPEIIISYAPSVVYGLQGHPNTPEFLGPNKVLATAKHFLGDGGTVDGVDQGETDASEEELRDIHGAGYGPAIEAGVQTVMASYSSWGGRKMHGRKDLLTDVLVGQMGFEGFVVGDWNGHGQIRGCTEVNCPDALLAGIDMFMAPDSWRGLFDTTLNQVRDGTIPVARLDEAVARILRVKRRYRLAERGRPSSRPLAGQFELLGAPEHRAVAREAVRKSLVLLKNENILPLPANARVLVAGDGADSMSKQTGGWTLSWQGNGNTREHFPGAQTVFEGLHEALVAGGGDAVLSVDGHYTTRPDAAIVVFGEDPYAEFEGDRADVDFADDGPLALLQRLDQADVPTIAVFLSGRPLYTTPEMESADAFVAAWLPGSEGGGIADLLIGDVSGAARSDFSGALSFSWPANPDQAAMNIGDEDYQPLFPYGFGLNYADEGIVVRATDQ